MSVWAGLQRWVRRFWLPKPPDGFRWILSEPGRAALLAPVMYSMHRENEDTVAVYPPGEDSGVTLRFSFHMDSVDPKLPEDVAMQFVRDIAAKRELDMTKLIDRVVASESREVDGPIGPALIHYWQVGVGKLLVVSSATVWGQNRDLPAIRDALEMMPRMIESLRLV